MANERMFLAGSEPDNYYNTGFHIDGYYWVGKSGGNGKDGAVRFPGVLGGGNCNEAQLFLHVDDASNNGGSMDLDIYGMDEDNTGLFTGNPMGRTKTSTRIDWFLNRPGENSFTNINVTGIVNEIRNRGGWSSGNAMGFMIFESGNTNDDIWFSGGSQDVPPSVTSCLVIRESANPNFFPTPTIVSAPTIPGGQQYGIRVSKIGVDVKSAQRGNLIYTSDENVLKIEFQGEEDFLGSGVQSASFAHNLGYKPFAMGFFLTGNNIEKLPGSGTFIITDTIIESVIPGGAGFKLIYYIFLDQQVS